MQKSTRHNIATDIHLANHFSSKMGEAYREGVEFMSTLPSHALVRFRDALELLCHRLALVGGDTEHPPRNLHQFIDSLLDAGAITFALKDRLHRIRKLCNIGAHRTAATSSEKCSKGESTEMAILTANAEAARDELVDVLQRLYMEQIGEKEELTVKKEIIDLQDWKALVFDASVGESPEEKYKAGLWCEAQAEKMLRSVTTVIVRDEFDIQYRFLIRLAANFHHAAYKLKANDDAMFRYASFVDRGYLDGERREEAVNLIRKAADQGHGRACEHYGCILHDDKQEYSLAEKYWLDALEKGCVRAYYCLGRLYKSGSLGKPEIEKALVFLEQGADEDDPDSLNMLGQWYFEGDGVPQSVEKARELLKKAADLGHGIARNYLILKVDGGEERIISQMQQIGMMLEMTQSAKKMVRSHKVRVNDKCPCGSGKKYKKCCGAG